MSIPVVFCRWGNEKNVASELGDCYILSGDNWDDGGYKTSFNVYIYKNSEQYGVFQRKILFKNQEKITSSSSLIEKLYQTQYLDICQINQDYKFISLGSEYTELKTIFEVREEFDDILKKLNDVIYLEKNEPQNLLLELKDHAGFEISLCRDQSAKKLLDEASYILYGDDLVLNRLKFNFNFDLNHNNYEYTFDFNKNDIPSRINILIGKNGSGKSQTLLSLSEYFLNPQESRVDSHPNFISNLMVFAYNIYEDFYVNKRNERLNIAYKYLGFKKVKELKDLEFNSYLSIPNSFYILDFLVKKYPNDLESELIRIGKENRISSFNDAIFDEMKVVNRNLLVEQVSSVINKLILDLSSIEYDIDNPTKATFESMKEIYIKDSNNFKHSIHLDDIPYRNKVIELLSEAFDCTSIGLKVENDENKEHYISLGFELIDNYLILETEIIHMNFLKEINFDNFEQKVYFFNKENLLYLSSGQQTFADLVINLLSLIKQNTLILVDEPENTLHPNFEIDYIKILTDILEEFDSFAIIATHSPLIVREVPTQYVNVIKLDKETNELSISHPSIGTFGGDIGTISNYVFDDILKDKKLHEEWFKKEYIKYNSFVEFEEKYRSILNYDFLLYCKNNWQDRWGF